MHVAAYIEQHAGSPQTIKKHLAAIKMLFDYLVISQIVRTNPVAPEGSTHVVKRGKTPVLSVEESRSSSRASRKNLCKFVESQCSEMAILSS
jgi:hypothetical protein